MSIDFGPRRHGWNPTGYECPRCGSLVLNREAHSRFHEERK